MRKIISGRESAAKKRMKPDAGWGAPAGPEWRHFIDEITTINLRRIWWLIVTSAGLNLGTVALNLLHPALQIPVLVLDHAIDFSLSAIFLGLVWWLRRHPTWRELRRAYVMVFAGVGLAMMDHYYFSMLPYFGHTSCYILGVATLGVLLLIPPRTFLAMLLLNHLFYLGLLWKTGGDTRFLVQALMDGSGGVLIAGLANWFLFAGQWDKFRKERLIRQRHQELLRSNAELQERNEEVHELMAIAAHDLRSPLYGLKNLLELANSPGVRNGDGNQLSRALTGAIGGVGEMLTLVSGLLEAHNAENLDRNRRLQEEDIRSRFREAVRRMETRARAKDLQVRMEMPDQPVLLTVDGEALDRVLDNLLSNAVKFSPPGREVVVVLRLLENQWSGEVQDEGPGISPEEQGRLFGKFHRGSAGPTGNEPSTGLGLFIVKKLMESMGGSVSYGPREPRGSVFRIQFR
jgi:signal transduction histidine kinase